MPRRVRMTVGYRGTRYAGWAVQPAAQTGGRPTLQATLSDALQQALGHSVHVAAAGRTDAGVHADAQVVSFETSSTLPADALQSVMPRWLPDDVWIVDAADTADAFDARRDA